MTVNLNHTNKFKNFLLKITQLSPERIIRQDHQNCLFDKRMNQEETKWETFLQKRVMVKASIPPSISEETVRRVL